MSEKLTYEELKKRVESLEQSLSDLERDYQDSIKSKNLINAIRKVQSLYIINADPSEIYRLLLNTLVDITESEYGFLDEVLEDEKGNLFKKNLAISNISWDEKSRKLYKQLQDRGMKFAYLNNLSGLPALTGKTIISNDPSKDIRSKGLPEGHPPIKSFLGMPLFYGGKLICVAGVGNRKEGYNEETANFLEPILSACAGITHALRIEAIVKENRRRLLESEERFRNLYENAPLGYQSLDAEGRFIEVNQAWLDLTGYSRTEVIGNWFGNFLAPHEIESYKRRFPQFLEKGEVHSELQMIKSDGSGIIVQINGLIGKDKNGQFKQTHCILLDITESKRAEKELRESEKKYRHLVEHAPTGIYNIDFLYDKFISINDAMVTFTGYSRDELLSMQVSSMLTDASKQLFFDRIKKASEGKEVPETVEMEFIIKDGTTRWASLSASYMYKDNKLIGASVIAQDITERRAAETALRESEEKYRDLVENINDIIYEIDRNGIITYISNVAETIIGYSPDELVGRNVFDFIHGEDQERIQKQLQKVLSGQLSPSEYRFIKKSGEIIWIRSSSRPIYQKGNTVGIRGVASNISETKAMEDQLRQSQKMEAIGTLAGGIAHEFNNILGIIIGNTELALDDVPAWNPAKDCLEEIRTSSLRAKDVVRKILSFARKTPADKKPIQVSTIISESLKLLRAAIPKTIDIQEEILCETEMILANPTEINQVLINLCTNSVHAMESETGLLNVHLEAVHLDDGAIVKYENLKPGNHVKLKIKDSGKGINPEIIDRIFDPYFTTKDVDQGLGMGLAVVHGIVKKHDGAINITSEFGKGTTVEVLFPIIEAEAEAEEIEPELIPTGTERILFVDDEGSLVKMAKQILERLGYQVFGKTDSIEALDLFRSKPDQFDLVITDMAMPHMAGDQLTREILKIRPDIPVILCTGHSERINEIRAKQLGITAYAMKPLERKNLIKIVRKILDEAKSKTQQ